MLTPSISTEDLPKEPEHRLLLPFILTHQIGALLDSAVVMQLELPPDLALEFRSLPVAINKVDTLALSELAGHSGTVWAAAFHQYLAAAQGSEDAVQGVTDLLTARESSLLVGDLIQFVGDELNPCQSYLPAGYHPTTDHQSHLGAAVRVQRRHAMFPHLSFVVLVQVAPGIQVTKIPTRRFQEDGTEIEAEATELSFIHQGQQVCVTSIGLRNGVYRVKAVSECE